MIITIWQRLGIAPTRSESAVREAYVRAVKQCHPEDKPEEWSLLHDAYRQALLYARGGNAQVPSTERADGDPDRDDGPESAYAEDFRAALSKSRKTASTVQSMLQELAKKRGYLTSRQARSLTELLFELRPDDDSDVIAGSEALRFFSAGRFTREALDVVYYDLQEWYLALPFSALRTRLKTVLDSLGRRRTEGDGKGPGGMDALFAWVAATISLLILAVSLAGGAFFAIVTGTFCFGMAYWLKSRNKRFLPSERRSRRLGRPILASVLAALLIVSYGGCRYYARQGLAEIHEQVENTYSAYDPSLRTGAAASLELAREPAFLCYFTKSTGQSAASGVSQAIYYDAVSVSGQRVLLYVEEGDAGAIAALDTPCTIYGKAAELDTEGSFMPKTILEYAMDYDVEEALGVMLETARQLRAEMTAAADGIGGRPVFRYTASEPGTRTVSAGYQPGRFPYCLCWAIGFGCVVHLILMLSRSVSPRRKRYA